MKKNYHQLRIVSLKIMIQIVVHPHQTLSKLNKIVRTNQSYKKNALLKLMSLTFKLKIFKTKKI